MNTQRKMRNSRSLILKNKLQAGPLQSPASWDLNPNSSFFWKSSYTFSFLLTPLTPLFHSQMMLFFFPREIEEITSKVPHSLPSQQLCQWRCFPSICILTQDRPLLGDQVSSVLLDLGTQFSHLSFFAPASSISWSPLAWSQRLRECNITHLLPRNTPSSPPIPLAWPCLSALSHLKICSHVTSNSCPHFFLSLLLHWSFYPCFLRSDLIQVTNDLPLNQFTIFDLPGKRAAFGIANSSLSSNSLSYQHTGIHPLHDFPPPTQATRPLLPNFQMIILLHHSPSTVSNLSTWSNKTSWGNGNVLELCCPVW